MGLGTVVSMKHLDSHIILQTLDKFKLLELCNWLGMKKILMFPKFVGRAAGVLVGNCKFHFNFILMFIRMLCGFSVKDKIANKYFEVMLAHQPGGTSANNVVQWIDCFRTGQLRRFDYGSAKNKEIYGSEQPHTYSLTHLPILPFKTYLFRG